MQNNFNYKNIDTWKDKFGGVVFAVIEITKGTTLKNELDCLSNMLIPVRALHKKYKYIFNYGFINQTYADDNDPMDIAIVCKEKLPPKSVLPCRVVGVIKTIDDNEQDDKIIAVPVYQSGGKEQPRKINMKRLIKYFSKYKYPLQKGTVIQGVGNEDEALSLIQKAADKYQQKFRGGIR
jgi:inorganic pyrophosphatase